MSDKKGGLSFRKKLKAQSETEKFEALIKKEPDNERAYIRLAELYARLGEDAKALELYEETSLLFEKKGFMTKARAILRQALAIDPEHGRINVLLADLDKNEGLNRDAAIRYQTAANYYIKIGNKQAAINILQKITEIFPNNVPTVLKLGNLLVSMQMFQEAISLLAPLTKKLQDTNRTADYINVLKLLYTATEGREPVIALRLVDIYITSKEYSKTLPILQSVIMQDEHNVEYLKKLVTVFQYTNEKTKLIIAYKQLATALQQHGRNTERTAIYQKVLELNPEDREALTVLDERDKLRNIVHDKIEEASDDEDDILIEIDMNDEDDLQEVSSETLTLLSDEEMCSKELEEGITFRKYSLFDKAENIIKSCPHWNKSPKTLDQLIEIALEQDDTEKASAYMSTLMDLFVDRGEISKATDLLDDMRSMLGDDETVTHYNRLLDALKHNEENESIEQDSTAASHASDTQPEETLQTDDILGDLMEESSLLSEDVVVKNEKDNTHQLDDVLAGVFDDMKEPPQSALDELEFYISIDDFDTAIVSLQDLLVSYPNSKFLADIQSSLPGAGGENISDTLSDVRDSLEQSGDGTASSNYDLGMMYRAMSILPDALKQFSEAQAKEPESIKYRLAVVDTLIELEQNDRAIKELENSLAVANDEQKDEINKRLDSLKN